MKRMAMKEWSASQLRLCELKVKVGAHSTEQPQGSVEVTVDYQSCPLPACILSALMAYDQALKDVEVTGVNADSTAVSRPSKQALEGFAEALTQSILCSAKCQRDISTVSVPGLSGPDDPHRPLWTPVPTESSVLCGSEQPSTGPAHEQMEGPGHTEGEAACDEDDFNPPLAQTSLPSEGSVDYPNAPPTSPLLLETVKSPTGFSRSLKRGLANGFRPSPPPPTPKEQLGPMKKEDQTDFVAHLMRSLSLECRQEELSSLGLKEGSASQTDVPTLSEHAAHLSSVIIGCLGTNGVEGAKEPIRADNCTGNPPTDSHEQPMLPPECGTLSMDTGTDSCNTGGAKGNPAQGRRPLHAAAEQWIKTAVEGALVEVVSKHGVAPVGNGLSPSRQSAEREPCAEGMKPLEQRDSKTQDLDAFAKVLAYQVLHQAVLCWHTGLASEAHTSVGRAGPQHSGLRSSQVAPPSSLYSYATRLTEEVLRDSIWEATKREELLSRNDGHTHIRRDARLWVACGGPGGPEVTALLGEGTQGTSEVLLGLILWAAASHTKVSRLQLTITDMHPHEQFCRVVQRAQMAGWTVGHLVTSLLWFCKQHEQLTKEVPCLSDDSLLQYLQRQLGGDS